MSLDTARVNESAGLCRRADTTDEALSGLLSECARGDERALARLYELTSQRIYTLLVRRTGSPSAAEDALVATYARVWREAATFTRSGRTALSWVAGLALDASR